MSHNNISLHSPHPYPESMLRTAQEQLGSLMELAVKDLGYDLDAFFRIFVDTGTAELFGEGHPRLVLGMTPVELAAFVLKRAGREEEINYTDSCYNDLYWTGWALSWYQWESGLSFAEILEKVPASRVLSLYNPLHQADIS